MKHPHLSTTWKIVRSPNPKSQEWKMKITCENKVWTTQASTGT